METDADECKERLKAIEMRKGRQKHLRRKINRAIQGTYDMAKLLKEMRSMWEPTFCEKDYVSGDGFQTAIWGPAAWHYLHITSLNYTPERKKAYEMLLDGFAGTLPCVHCRNNFRKNYEAAESAMQEKGQGYLEEPQDVLGIYLAAAP